MYNDTNDKITVGEDWSKAPPKPSHTITLKLHNKKNLNTSSYITQIFHDRIDFFTADLYVNNKFPNYAASVGSTLS